MIAPEYFNNHVAVEGEIIVKSVPNDAGFVLVWNPTTKKISRRTHAELISDLNLVTSNQLGNYWQKYDNGSYRGIDDDSGANFSFLTNGGVTAKKINTGGLLTSDEYSDQQYIPANGIYSKGNIATLNYGSAIDWAIAYNWTQTQGATMNWVNANFVTINTAQDINARKSIGGGTGNEYTGAALEIRGNGSTIFPSIAFHQPGVFAATLSFRSNGFNFMNANANGFEYVSTAGFIKEGSNDGYLLLGGGGHLPVSSFASGNYTSYQDNREINPSEMEPKKIGYGFTTWDNNNNSPYADYLHFGGYQDDSGGRQNLIVFRKDGFGLRQWQGEHQSINNYSDYVDYWHTGSLPNPVDQSQLSGYVRTTGDQNIDGIKGFTGAYTQWILNGDPANARGFVQSASGGFLAGTLNDNHVVFYRNSIEKIVVEDLLTTFRTNISVPNAIQNDHAVNLGQLNSQMGNYLPLSGGTLTSGGRIDSQGNIIIQQTDVGGNATGLFWENIANTDKIAGIGTFTQDGIVDYLYMGWGAAPWQVSTSFSVNSDIIQYKGNVMWHAGNLDPVTINTPQTITAHKTFAGATGNDYIGSALMVNGDGATNTIFPTIAFHQPGLYAGTVSYRDNEFYFMNVNGNGFEYIRTAGFIKSGSHDGFVLLGAGGHKPISDFATSTDLSNYVTINTPQTIIGSKTYAPTSDVKFLGTDANHINVFRSAAVYEIVSGHEYTHYNTSWKVGNKRGGGTDNIGYAFQFSDDAGATYDEIVLIQADGNILTSNFGAASDWNAKVSQSQLANYWSKSELPDYRNYGLGRSNEGSTNYNLNNIAETSILGINDTTTSRPSGLDYGSVWTHRKNSGEFTQIAVDVITGQSYVRGWSNGSGDTGWRKHWDNINLPNPVRGGGFGTFNNTVYLGWTNTQLQIQVDNTVIGNIWHTGNLPDYRNYGLGTTLPNAGNIDDQRETGMYYIGSGSSGNIPWGYASVFHTKYTPNEYAQLAIRHGSDGLAFRTNGYDWKIVYHEGNFNPNTKANGLQNAKAIGFSSGSYPTDDGVEYPYMYFDNGSLTGYIALATQDFVNTGFHKIDNTGSISNGSDGRSNKSFFDYSWAGTGYAGSVINFSGLGGYYSTELFADYTSNTKIGIRTHNGDSANTWTPVRWLWHDGNFNPASYVTQSALNTQLGSYATLNGVQTFNNTNTFNQSPVIPNGTLGNHAVNLNQLLDVAPPYHWNYVGQPAITNRRVLREMTWNNYGNGHTIFDISSGTTPWGTSKSNVDAEQQWSPSYPTLVGGNGSGTYGVRVDSSRVSDTTNSLGGYGSGDFLNTTYLNNKTLDSSDATVKGVMTNYSPSSDPDKPVGVTDGSLLTLNYSSIWSTQLYGDWRNKDLYFRTQNGGVWNTYSKFWHTDNFNPSQYVTQTGLNFQLGNYATLAGVQTFNNTNTFNQSPIIPHGTLGNHAVNLNQLNGKVNNLENVTGVGFSSGNADAAPYFYHPVNGYRFLATQTWVGQNYVDAPDGYSIIISGQNLDDILNTGFYRGSSLGTAPENNTGWWYVTVEGHDSSWTKQTVTSYGSGNISNRTFQRVRNGGAWTLWKEFEDASNAVRVNHIFSANTGNGIFIGDGNYGNESGLIDVTNESIIAGKDQDDYYKYGAKVGYSGGMIMQISTGHMSYGGVMPTPSFNHYFNGTIRITNGISSESTSGEDVYCGDGELLKLDREIVRDGDHLRYNRFSRHFGGTYNTFSTDHKDVRIVLRDGGDLIMSRYFRDQEIVIMNISNNDAVFLVDNTSVVVKIPSKCSATFYVDETNQMILVRMDVKYTDIVS